MNNTIVEGFLRNGREFIDRATNSLNDECYEDCFDYVQYCASSFIKALLYSKEIDLLSEENNLRELWLIAKYATGYDVNSLEFPCRTLGASDNFEKIISSGISEEEIGESSLMLAKVIEETVILLLEGKAEIHIIISPEDLGFGGLW